MFCQECGADVSGTDSFCSECGAGLEPQRQSGAGSRPFEYERYGPSVLPQEMLAEGEFLLYESRPLLWVRLVEPVVATVLGVAACAVAYAYFSEYVWILYVLAGAIVLGLSWIALRALRWRYTVYAATNRRLLRQTGIIGRDHIDLPIDRVQTVYVRIPVLGRLFRFGTIRVATAGSGWIEMQWEDVREPRRGQRILNEVLEQYRARQQPVRSET